MVSKSRYPELGYRNVDKGLWRIVDLTDDRNSDIGPHYHTKAELLADLDRYAEEFGCVGTKPLMRTARLIEFKPYGPDKWKFQFDNGNSLVLRETWDEVLQGAELEAVERWLINTYGFAIDFFGLRLFK